MMSKIFVKNYEVVDFIENDNCDLKCIFIELESYEFSRAKQPIIAGLCS